MRVVFASTITLLAASAEVISAEDSRVGNDKIKVTPNEENNAMVASLPFNLKRGRLDFEFH
ncbi:hypothetical protein F441_03816 [Phytophthora nicotianae CJ01A1]|uniref:RxLR effector protein n=1 Tax=Phytophthora nicotianae CJ01A1 TaxID=1317063 RepID=W2XJB8_PHYNI|nr:hypothetical protein F441_03816 [Phytophthora nicotianae CJ01A1]